MTRASEKQAFPAITAVGGHAGWRSCRLELGHAGKRSDSPDESPESSIIRLRTGRHAWLPDTSCLIDGLRADEDRGH